MCYLTGGVVAHHVENQQFSSFFLRQTHCVSTLMSIFINKLFRLYSLAVHCIAVRAVCSEM